MYQLGNQCLEQRSGVNKQNEYILGFGIRYSLLTLRYREHPRPKALSSGGRASTEACTTFGLSEEYNQTMPMIRSPNSAHN